MADDAAMIGEACVIVQYRISGPSAADESRLRNRCAPATRYEFGRSLDRFTDDPRAGKIEFDCDQCAPGKTRHIGIVKLKTANY
jgi:hypothetical protein